MIIKEQVSSSESQNISIDNTFLSVSMSCKIIRDNNSQILFMSCYKKISVTTIYQNSSRYTRVKNVGTLLYQGGKYHNLQKKNIMTNKYVRLLN